MEPIIEKRQLRCDFSALEITNLSKRLADKTHEFNSVTDEKKTINSQYSSKLQGIKAECNDLATKVTSGYELREVECEIIYNKPEQGRKTIIRKDMNKTHAIEKMEKADFNLFNQASDINPETDGITKMQIAEPEKPPLFKDDFPWEQNSDIDKNPEGIQEPGEMIQEQRENLKGSRKSKKKGL